MLSILVSILFSIVCAYTLCLAIIDLSNRVMQSRSERAMNKLVLEKMKELPIEQLAILMGGFKK